ncbi:MAG: hypothetical protein K8T25_14235 [Planctomycetia bacterium]|nr:hypothetical protein [Planctomycetia bacterium]
MAQNPYQSPADFRPGKRVPPFGGPVQLRKAIGIRSGEWSDLRKVARCQRGLIGCILLQLISLPLAWTLPEETATVFALTYFFVGMLSTVFVFLLAIRVYGVFSGIVAGILVFLPCLGLLEMLALNGKATAILRSNGIRVGLMGAKMADFDKQP